MEARAHAEHVFVIYTSWGDSPFSKTGADLVDNLRYMNTRTILEDVLLTLFTSRSSGREQDARFCRNGVTDRKKTNVYLQGKFPDVDKRVRSSRWQSEREVFTGGAERGSSLVRRDPAGSRRKRANRLTGRAAFVECESRSDRGGRREDSLFLHFFLQSFRCSAAAGGVKTLLVPRLDAHSRI
ncbi:hypothetical protein Baya_15538 [Bagarius yarrelli]|uniref:Uncharacterized protein n=1 Tax=Bagarius yarrelli TaxID=175774 RepID=A0A556VC11_BAGYA|nr:hypothetical protein Baya_15538 [Bagarius yarrelli]